MAPAPDESGRARARARTTRMLVDACEGDGLATERLTPLIYDELRSLAASYLRRERAGHTLEPTALVHEAYVRLIDGEGLAPRDERHFLALAANVMRRVLVDHARARGRDKRGGGACRVTLLTDSAAEWTEDVDALALDQALERLAGLSVRQARVVELRFFGGLTVAEVAEALRVSKRSVELDWTLARAFLRRELVGAT